MNIALIELAPPEQRDTQRAKVVRADRAEECRGHPAAVRPTRAFLFKRRAVVLAGERRVAGCGHTGDARKRPEPLQELVKELWRLAAFPHKRVPNGHELVPVLGLGQGDAKRQEPIGSETKIDSLQAPETVDEQSSSDQQDERKRSLQDNKRGSQTPVAVGSGKPPSGASE